MINEGDVFNRLTAVRYLYKDSRHRKWFLFKCSCGELVETHTGSVRSGNTKSCGCLVRDTGKKRKLPNNTGVINQVMLGYKRHAKGRNLSFSLTPEQFRVIIALPCHYCGTVESNCRVTKNCKEGFKYNGVDRVDNTVGYEQNNVVACCKICNRAKGNLSKAEFMNWISAMAAQWGGKV